MTSDPDQPDLDALQRSLQHALDVADYLLDNGKIISDLMLDSLGDLPPVLDKDEYRELQQTLRAVERLQYQRVMRACG